MVDKLVNTIEQMTKAADSKYQVTLNMVMTALKMKCCEKTARRALHARGVRFHPMREKPVPGLSCQGLQVGYLASSCLWGVQVRVGCLGVSVPRPIGAHGQLRCALRGT